MNCVCNKPMNAVEDLFSCVCATIQPLIREGYDFTFGHGQSRMDFGPWLILQRGEEIHRFGSLEEMQEWHGKRSA